MNKNKNNNNNNNNSNNNNEFLTLQICNNNEAKNKIKYK